MEENTYEVLDNGFDKVVTESAALELLQKVAEEIYTFTLLAPKDCSKIKLIKRLDDFREDMDIAIRPQDNKTNLSLTTKDGKLVYALASCDTTGRALRIRPRKSEK